MVQGAGELFNPLLAIALYKLDTTFVHCFKLMVVTALPKCTLPNYSLFHSGELTIHDVVCVHMHYY